MRELFQKISTKIDNFLKFKESKLRPEDLPRQIATISEQIDDIYREIMVSLRLLSTDNRVNIQSTAIPLYFEDKLRRLQQAIKVYQEFDKSEVSKKKLEDKLDDILYILQSIGEYMDNIQKFKNEAFNYIVANKANFDESQMEEAIAIAEKLIVMMDNVDKINELFSQLTSEFPSADN